MDLPAQRRVHVSTGIDSPAQTACWPIRSSWLAYAVSVARDGHRGGQGENLVPQTQAMLCIKVSTEQHRLHMVGYYSGVYSVDTTAPTLLADCVTTGNGPKMASTSAYNL